MTGPSRKAKKRNKLRTCKCQSAGGNVAGYLTRVVDEFNRNLLCMSLFDQMPKWPLLLALSLFAFSDDLGPMLRTY